MDTTYPDTLSTSGVPVQEREPVFFGRGTCIDRYVVVDRLGHGGMGVVYKAYDPELDRSLALKLLRVNKGSSAHRATARRRLLREAQALAQVSHPNVITVYDVGTHGHDVYIAMELVKGRTLRRWIADKSPSRAQVVKALVAAGQGLAAAHKVGLIHRDFKPANIMVGDDGRVRVLDFGLARFVGALDSSDSLLDVGPRIVTGESSDTETVELPPAEPEPGPEPEDDTGPVTGPRLLSSPLTAFGTVIGTPNYMAPEQLRLGGANKATDQYSFCVTLYEALYGERPFSGADHAELVEHTTTAAVKPPPDGTNIPNRLRRIALRGLAVDPAGRYPTMGDLLSQLEHDPWVVRRRVLAAAVAVLCVIGGTVAFMHTSANAESRCAAAGASITKVWGAAPKSEIKQRFERSGRRYAQDTFQRVEVLIDNYTTRWRTARVSACEATHVQRVQSEDLLDRRMACLDRRSEQLGALVTLLSQASPDVVDRAIRSVMELPPASVCADASTMMAAIPPPATPQGRVAVKHLRHRLYTLQARRRTGQYKALLEPLKQLSSDALAVDYAPVQTEVLAELARIQHKLRLMKDAEQTLRKMAKASATAQMDHATAWVWQELMSILSLQARRRKDALMLVPVAESSLIRGGNAVDDQFDLRSRIAILHFLRGDYPRALAGHQAALRLGEKALGPDAFALTNSIMGLANIAQRQGKPAEAARHYRRALAITKKTFGPEHPEVAIGLSNLGALLSESEPAKALVLQNKALDIWLHVYGENHTRVATVLNNMGISYQRLRNYQQARASYQRALAIWETLGEKKKLASILTNIGDMLMDQGKSKEALPYFRRDLQLTRESLGTKHPFYGTSLHNMGNALAANGEFRKAYKFQRDALAVFETRLGKKHGHVAYPLTSMGECLIGLNRRAQAIVVLERALAIRTAKAKPADTSEDLAETRFLLARALWSVPTQSAKARRRATRLATKAHTAYAATKSRHAPGVATWLAKHQVK